MVIQSITGSPLLNSSTAVLYTKLFTKYVTRVDEIKENDMG
jgi:hypothetical protein